MITNFSMTSNLTNLCEGTCKFLESNYFRLFYILLQLMIFFCSYFSSVQVFRSCTSRLRQLFRKLRNFVSRIEKTNSIFRSWSILVKKQQTLYIFVLCPNNSSSEKNANVECSCQIPVKWLRCTGGFQFSLLRLDSLTFHNCVSFVLVYCRSALMAALRLRWYIFSACNSSVI